jgi:protein O-mannosyl-transferase
VTRERARRILLAALLAVSVCVVYGQVWRHAFVEYDDSAYVSDNPFVRRGLTLEGVGWAFTTGKMGNWNPLTWLSHMLDVQLFGVNPGAHHLVNLAFHLGNTLLLLAVLCRMTQAWWPSFIVAALFGLHPLHVESVAWIAERKDVLSTFLWFLTLWAYVRYVEARSRRWYAAALALFGLGLMAKPMLVTVPFVLLLLDLWPLGRLASWGGAGSPGRRAAALSPAALVREKIPFFLLAAAASALAYVTQQHSGAVAATVQLPISLRLANALVAYVRYLGKAVWPVDLAVLYPYDTSLPLWQPLAAALLLAAISGACLALARRHPYALIGWLWYLGTLIPVIGLVQIGSQALADRYTYVPLVGVFVMIAWGGRALVTRWGVPIPLVGVVTAAVIGAYAAAAWSQVGLWKDGETLLSHTARVTEANCIAHNNLGVALAAQGKTDAALVEYREALRIKPDYPDPYDNVGLVLWRRGQREDAAAQYRTALRYDPDAAETHNNLGVVLTEMGQTEDAIGHLSDAIRLDPDFAVARNNLGNALRNSGRIPEALAQYELASRLKPDYADPYNNIGAILAQQDRRDEAAAQFRTALRYDPQSANAHDNLGVVLSQMGQTDEAIAQFTEGVRLAPDDLALRNHLGNALHDSGHLAEAIDQYEQILQRRPDDAEVHYKLGITLTESGRAGDAIGHFQAALRLEPEYAQAHNDLGVALVDAGRLSEAIPHFEQALRINPDLADAQFNLEAARQMNPSAARGPTGRPGQPAAPADAPHPSPTAGAD